MTGCWVFPDTAVAHCKGGRLPWVLAAPRGSLCSRGAAFLCPPCRWHDAQRRPVVPRWRPYLEIAAEAILKKQTDPDDARGDPAFALALIVRVKAAFAEQRAALCRSMLDAR